MRIIDPHGPVGNVDGIGEGNVVHPGRVDHYVDGLTYAVSRIDAVPFITWIMLAEVHVHHY